MPPTGVKKTGAKKGAMKTKGAKKQKSVIRLSKKRDVKGLMAALRATVMTKEEWKTYQTDAYKKKWPKPEYMSDYRSTFVRDGGEGAYRDQTYELVTRWSAETKIRYRPHAKAPGSKSHVRYEKYSKARTVAQALALGSWPLDWCHDYEHGFIQVLGPVRDEPLDISQHNGKLTEVDEAICAWHRKELAKRHNLKIEDLYVDKGAGEGLLMRCHRLVTDRKAEEILTEANRKKKTVTDQEVEGVLSSWAFAKNFNRANVMPKGQEWVWSDTIGLLRDRVGDIHLTGPTTRYPAFTMLINRWLTDRLPKEVAGFSFTSLNLNCQYAAARHRDGNNFGPSMIKGFGAFSGGRLGVFPEDDREIKDVKKLPQRDRVSADLKSNLVMFNGNSAHEVEDFEGSRFSVVYFTLGCFAKAKKEDEETMRRLGFPVPAKDEDPHKFLRKPQGYKNCGVKAGVPTLRQWPAKKLAKSAKPRGGSLVKELADVKKRHAGRRCGTKGESAAKKSKATLERVKASRSWRCLGGS